MHPGLAAAPATPTPLRACTCSPGAAGPKSATVVFPPRLGPAADTPRQEPLSAALPRPPIGGLLSPAGVLLCVWAALKAFSTLEHRGGADGTLWKAGWRKRGGFPVLLPRVWGCGWEGASPRAGLECCFPFRTS